MVKALKPKRLKTNNPKKSRRTIRRLKNQKRPKKRRRKSKKIPKTRPQKRKSSSKEKNSKFYIISRPLAHFFYSKIPHSLGRVLRDAKTIDEECSSEFEWINKFPMCYITTELKHNVQEKHARVNRHHDRMHKERSYLSHMPEIQREIENIVDDFLE